MVLAEHLFDNLHLTSVGDASPDAPNSLLPKAEALRLLLPSVGAKARRL